LHKDNFNKNEGYACNLLKNLQIRSRKIQETFMQFQVWIIPQSFHIHM